MVRVATVVPVFRGFPRLPLPGEVEATSVVSRRGVTSPRRPLGGHHGSKEQWKLIGRYELGKLLGRSCGVEKESEWAWVPREQAEKQV